MSSALSWRSSSAEELRRRKAEEGSSRAVFKNMLSVISFVILIPTKIKSYCIGCEKMTMWLETSRLWHDTQKILEPRNVCVWEHGGGGGERERERERGKESGEKKIGKLLLLLTAPTYTNFPNIFLACDGIFHFELITLPKCFPL
jgi:hypothetical protein